MSFGIQSLRLQFSPFQFNLLSPLTHAFLHRKQGYVVSSTLLTQKMQAFDYFLVLDFEATCDNEKRIVPQEIIEFPVLKINSRTLETESKFHTYVQPTVHKRLRPFCTELTGIIQDMVDNQPTLSEVLKDFHEWMLKNKLLEPEVKPIFVTCGDWDLKTMLPNQCAYFDLESKPYFSRWINIKRAFSTHTATWPRGLPSMLEKLRLPYIGRHHSGIDDCMNIAAILVELIKRGYVFTKSDVQYLKHR